MRQIIIGILVFVTFSAFGQNHFIGFKSGINWTNVNSDNFINDNHNRIGFTGGLNYEYHIKKKLILGLELLYVKKGFENDFILTDLNGNQTGEKATFKYNYDYISFPIKGGHTIGNRISGFVNLGIVPSILINAKHIMPSIDNTVVAETIDVTDQVKRIEIGGLIEIGGSYKIKDELLIFTSFAYQSGFTTITNPDYFSDSKVRHYGMTLSIGLKYALKKE